MAIAVTPNLTNISLCEAVDSWSAGATSADYALQGTYALGIQVKATLSAVVSWTFGTPAIMTGKHIYIWMMCTGKVDTIANGGFRIYVETDATHYGTWYVGGNDVTPGGWNCFIIDPASTPTSGLGTINPASITKVGVQFKTLTSALGTTLNCFWDACRYGSGLTITSGVADAITFENIYAIDNDSTLKYGVVQKALGGAYIVQGLLTFGGTGAENIGFIDKSQVVLFPANAFISASFYGIKVLAGSGVVNFTLGEKSGTAGIKGCLLKAPGTKKFSLDVSDTDIDIMQLYGCNFNNAGTITLLPNAANREVLNCAFEACGEVIVNTCILTNCNFISSDGSAVLMSDPSHDVNTTKCNFISCPEGVKINTYGVGYSFNALIFTACTYHVNNTSGQPLSIGKANGSNPSTYTGSAVTFTGSVDLTMTVKNEAGAVIVGAFAFIDQSPPEAPYIMNTTTNPSGIATVSWTGGIVNGSTWRVRKYGYKNFKQAIDIGESNISLPITLVADPQQT